MPEVTCRERGRVRVRSQHHEEDEHEQRATAWLARGHDPPGRPAQGGRWRGGAQRERTARGVRRSSSSSGGGAANSTGTPVPAQRSSARAASFASAPTGGGAKDTIDAHLPTTDPDIMRQWNMYESLAVRSPDFSSSRCSSPSRSSPSAASPTRGPSASRTASSSTTARRVGADDVIFSLKRITDPKDPKVGNSSLSYIDRDNLKKVDERTVRIPLKLTNAAFPDDLGQYFNAIVPTDYDPQEAGRHGAVQVPEVLARPAQRVRQEPELLAERQAVRRPADDHRLPRRHGARQRAARRPGRGDQQPAGGPGRRHPAQPEHAGR